METICFIVIFLLLLAAIFVGGWYITELFKYYNDADENFPS